MMTSLPRTSSAHRRAGFVLIGVALLSVLAMSHHPQGLAQLALARGVHGGLIALSLALLVGFWDFSGRLGLDALRVKAALTVYAFAIFSACLAATVNGFVVPGLKEGGLTDPAVYRLAWALNQALAYLSAFAVAGASLLWGLMLLKRPSKSARALGLLGLLSAVLPAGALALGLLNMHVTGALLVYTAHWLFAGLAGAWMVWGD